MAGETTKEEQQHFRRGTVVICVGSSSKPMYRNMICAYHAVFFHPLCTLWNQGCQMQTVWIVIEVRWDEDATTSCLFINSLCLGCNTYVDIVGVDDDPSLFENGTVAWLLFSLGMCNELWCGKASNHSADIVGKVEKVFILFGIDGLSSPTSG